MLKNMSIKVMVFTFIILTAIILCISNIMAILLFDKVSGEALDAKERHLTAATYANEMKIATIQVWQFFTDVSATGNREGYKDVEENVRIFKESLTRLKNIDPASTEQLDALDKQFDNFYTVGIKMAEVYIADGREKGNIIMKDYDKTGSELSDLMDSVSNRYHSSFNYTISELVMNLKTSKVQILTALIIGLTFLAISSLIIINKIIPSLSALNHAMKGVKEGDGDLRSRIKIDSKDEIGAVSNSFNGLISDIHNIISEIQTAFSILKETAGQLSTNANQTSATAVETASTVNEMAYTIEQVSENAQKAAALSEETSREAEQGAIDVDRITSQMKIIALASEKTSQVVESLTSNLNQINQIVQFITQIADQTNLLALNAAIEAARAGEQGRGFTVVAEEVRKLAEQSASAAKNINKLIVIIQLESQRAVEAMVEGNRHAVEGKAVVGEVGDRFNKITSSVKGLANQIQNVAAASEQILSGVQNIASTTEEQTATMEEVSASTEKLAQMAEDLNQLVGRFKV